MTIALGALAATGLWGGAPAPAPGKEEPVGLVLTATGGKVLRAGTETPLAAHSGDILFSGDELRAETSPASFLYCPGKTSQTLDQGGDLLVDSKQLKVKTGKISDSKPVNACFLPQLVRLTVASQQHYGVSMTRGVGEPADVVPVTSLPADVRAQIEPLEAALKANPGDFASLVSEAAIYDQNKLEANALAIYKKIAAQWPDAVWVNGRIFELTEALAAEAAAKAASISADAKTFALLVGISKYQKLPQDLWLHYADADAKSFSEYLASPRGGSVPADQIKLLLNETATTAAVSSAFETFLKKRAGKNDTVFILIAGHGAVDSKGAYLLTYDSDPEDPSATALKMSDLQALVTDQLANVGRVVFLFDVCHAAAIENLKTTTVGNSVAALGDSPGKMLGLLATTASGTSLEGPEFGGGHGVFTYEVLKGLTGDADADKNQIVDAGELTDYVRNTVSSVTARKQRPRDFGEIEPSTKLSDLTKPGIPMTRLKTFDDPATGLPLLFAQAEGTLPISPQAQSDINAFNAAIKAGHILQTDPGSAWNYRDRLKNELSPDSMFLRDNDLRVALEEKAQLVLLSYLHGGEEPQRKADFDAGAQYMEAAALLMPDSQFLKARDSFFRGRALLFDQKYSDAAPLLEQAVRADPTEAYGYNALGIAYLEQAKFPEALPAFRDAARLAPNWSYPLLGQALAYTEEGDNTNAIRVYLQAIKLNPKYGFLPYNLGLLYEKMNRRREAETEYRKAIALAAASGPGSGMPFNALGTLLASEGKNAEAEKLYRDAMTREPSLIEARHNLALLLSKNKDRQAEAIALWQQNLQTEPDYLASRIGLAGLFAQRGDNAAAIEQYRLVVAARPEYVFARTTLAALLIRTNQIQAGLDELRAASRLTPRNASIWEDIGDAEKSLNHAAEARDAYATALKLESEKADQKRVRTKMAF
jgi:Flp pilus assembly protein TadD